MFSGRVRLGKESSRSIGMRSSAFSLQSRYLAIGHLQSEVSLAFEPMYELTLGSKRRAKEARQFVICLLKRRRIKSWKEGEEVRASFPPHAADKLPDLLSEIDAALDAFRKQRLHPLVVEEILGITPSERRRWTKDGRLPQSGSGSFGRGRQSIHFALRPAAKIAALARQPEMIEDGTRSSNETCASRKRSIGKNRI
jgi:hypothetical protein